MFVPDGLKTNAYRVLRLSANATLSEIHRAADSLRRTAKLGLAGTNEADNPLLGEVTRLEADIRRAIGRLANPLQRLNDRLFWFHRPRHPRNADSTALATEAIPGPPDRAARCHDEALTRLFVAFEAGLDDAGVELWVQALRAWHIVVSEDDYWAFVLALEERGGFEPVALPSDVDALRDDVVRLAADGLIVAGRDALARSETSTVRRILAALRALADTGPWAEAAQEDIASPAVERYRALCRAVCEECGSKIAYNQDAAEPNKGVCDAALKRFRSEIEPALHGVTQILPLGDEAAQQSREEAALCLASIATAYTWADDFTASEELHEEALRLAKDTLGAIRIEHGLAEVRDLARKQRVFGALKPISSLPSLAHESDFGFRLYGKSDYDPETQSYATTCYFVLLFIPVFPIARYRVIDTEGGYRFLGKLPLRKGDRWHLGIVAAAIATVVLIGIINSSRNTGSSYTPSPSSGYNLASLKARIDISRSKLENLEPQLQPVREELTTLEARMGALASELKSLDRLRNLWIQIDIDDYNAKEETRKGLLSRYRALKASNSSTLQLYENLVDEHNALVAQYNALLR